MFKTLDKQFRQSPVFDRPSLAGRLGFGLSLFAVLLLLFCLRPQNKVGDYLEYGAMTIAIASHGTPAIRLSDVQEAQRLNPEPRISAQYAELEKGIRKNADTPFPAFYHGRDGSYYSIHFFAYSALAAIPFAAFKALGIPPFKCYQFVNLAFIFILGLACFEFFRSKQRAALALGLFAFCGGLLYWDWSSPEAMTAAALLTGLLLYFSGAPIAGGVLAGLASMQNPPLVFFAGFAPFLAYAYKRTMPSAREAVSLAIVALLFSLPVLFNLAKFGVPSLLAAATTETRLISGIRLYSLFFDLNQGMVIGVPALFAALAAILLFGKPMPIRLLACGAVLFSLALALPALTAQNWNSGAAGMMRYAFWAAMPILFACLLYARDHKVPTSLILALILVQAGVSWMERRYSHVEFSPAARYVLAHFPAAYNPPIEIFSERLRNQEAFTPRDSVLTYTVGGQVKKIAINLENKQTGLTLCGKNRELAPDTRFTSADDGWSYLNGAPVCNPMLTEDAAYGARDFADAAALKFTQGWGSVEFGGANWDGIWTVAPVARFELTPPSNLPYKTLSIHGQYVAPGMETEVSVNGVHLGRFALDRGLPIPVKGALRNHEGRSIVELRNVPIKNPAPASGDPRQLGFFVTKIVLRGAQP
ncbi:hypothetical protein [Massilia aerilata]|uniref:Uncharacterized protein n=1 Tax=Massilia aerilata TaxID=453817 RepID=A0ABW0RWX6_9BURK